MANATLVTVGQRISGGRGDDADAGRIDAIDGSAVTVAWDSGVVTTQALDAIDNLQVIQ